MELKSYEARPGKPRRAYDTRRQPRQLAHHAEAHQTCWYQMNLTQRSLATKVGTHSTSYDSLLNLPFPRSSKR